MVPQVLSGFYDVATSLSMELNHVNCTSVRNIFYTAMALFYITIGDSGHENLSVPEIVHLYKMKSILVQMMF